MELKKLIEMKPDEFCELFSSSFSDEFAHECINTMSSLQGFMYILGSHGDFDTYDILRLRGYDVTFNFGRPEWYRPQVDITQEVNFEPFNKFIQTISANGQFI